MLTRPTKYTYVGIQLLVLLGHHILGSLVQTLGGFHVFGSFSTCSARMDGRGNDQFGSQLIDIAEHWFERSVHTRLASTAQGSSEWNCSKIASLLIVQCYPTQSKWDMVNDRGPTSNDLSVLPRCVCVSPF